MGKRCAHQSVHAAGQVYLKRTELKSKSSFSSKFPRTNYPPKRQQTRPGELDLFAVTNPHILRAFGASFIYLLFLCLDRSIPRIPGFPSLDFPSLDFPSFGVFPPIFPRGEAASFAILFTVLFTVELGTTPPGLSSSPSASNCVPGVLRNGVLSPRVGDMVICCRFLNDRTAVSSISSSKSAPRKDARAFISPRSESGNFFT